jgi:hypothetical protein
MEFSYQLMTEYLISSRDWLKKHCKWRKAASDPRVLLFHPDGSYSHMIVLVLLPAPQVFTVHWFIARVIPNTGLKKLAMITKFNEWVQLKIGVVYVEGKTKHTTYTHDTLAGWWDIQLHWVQVVLSYVWIFFFFERGAKALPHLLNKKELWFVTSRVENKWSLSRYENKCMGFCFCFCWKTPILCYLSWWL